MLFLDEIIAADDQTSIEKTETKEEIKPKVKEVQEEIKREAPIS